jgi:hypothetical protein
MPWKVLLLHARTHLQFSLTVTTQQGIEQDDTKQRGSSSCNMRPKNNGGGRNAGNGHGSCSGRLPLARGRSHNNNTDRGPPPPAAAAAASAAAALPPRDPTMVNPSAAWQALVAAALSTATRPQALDPLAKEEEFDQRKFPGADADSEAEDAEDRVRQKRLHSIE